MLVFLLTAYTASAAVPATVPPQTTNYVIAIILLGLGLVGMVVLLLSERQKLHRAHDVILENERQLNIVTEKLNDNAKIREEYIGYFVNMISMYIQKIEKLKQGVERKLTQKKYEDIAISFRDINIKKEREALFTNFDNTFLRLFPNFISDFNSLLKESDQVWPKEAGVLNTDLRIFALLRLGISDCETMGSILEYSPNTIYVYKTRIKSKAILPGEHFEQAIMAIKAVTPEVITLYQRSA